MKFSLWGLGVETTIDELKSLGGKHVRPWLWFALVSAFLLGGVGRALVNQKWFSDMPYFDTLLAGLCGASPIILIAIILALRDRRNPITPSSPAYLADREPAQRPNVLGTIHDVRWLDGKKLEHSLSAHPHPKTVDSSIVYEIPKGYRHLRGEVGIADTDSEGKRIDGACSPLTFEICGDDKTLWTSRNMQEAKSLQPFDVDLKGVTVLTLHVQCHVPNNGSAWAMWIRPILCI